MSNLEIIRQEKLINYSTELLYICDRVALDAFERSTWDFISIQIHSKLKKMIDLFILIDYCRNNLPIELQARFQPYKTKIWSCQAK